jgi:hypothetical protein
MASLLESPFNTSNEADEMVLLALVTPLLYSRVEFG